MFIDLSPVGTLEESSSSISSRRTHPLCSSRECRPRLDGHRYHFEGRSRRSFGKSKWVVLSTTRLNIHAFRQHLCIFQRELLHRGSIEFIKDGQRHANLGRMFSGNNSKKFEWWKRSATSLISYLPPRSILEILILLLFLVPTF